MMLLGLTSRWTRLTACAAAWPPVQVTGTPTAGNGANAALVATTSRSDGTKQVTYNGHPLYFFARDGDSAFQIYLGRCQ